MLSESERVARLAPPLSDKGPVRMVLDTDTYNEIDDQFAIAQAMLSPEQLTVEAIYAAPFHNSRSSGAGDGMEKSYEEIHRVLHALGRTDLDGFVFRGAHRFLREESGPLSGINNEAALDLITRAAGQSSDSGLLYVVAIGAPTNIAHALLLEPRLAEKIVVVWLGGHALGWPHADEFNLRQDLCATRVLLNSGVPLVHLPCLGAASHLQTTLPEMEAYVAGHGQIGDYLFHIFQEHRADQRGWAKVLWDMSAVAWLIDSSWVLTNLVASPLVSDDLKWSADAQRHLIRSAYFVDRNGVFLDFFNKLARPI